MPKSDVRRIFDAAAELGFTTPELRSGGHYATNHPDTSETVFFPATPSDNRGIDNVISQLQRVSGRRLSKQRGYSGGQRFSPDQPVDMHSRRQHPGHCCRPRSAPVEVLGVARSGPRDRHEVSRVTSG